MTLDTCYASFTDDEALDMLEARKDRVFGVCYHLLYLCPAFKIVQHRLVKSDLPDV